LSTAAEANGPAAMIAAQTREIFQVASKFMTGTLAVPGGHCKPPIS
jgi:hypothetical protein